MNLFNLFNNLIRVRSQMLSRLILSLMYYVKIPFNVTSWDENQIVLILNMRCEYGLMM